jgi:uridine phosphorylase
MELSVMKQSELILNPDGSVYHLKLLPGDVARTVILVGDPDRVGMVSKYFDEVTVRKVKREFITHTGRVGNTSLTVMSTGIGTDNVDIAINEIDALFNIDFATRLQKTDLTELTFIRVGTSGAIQHDLPVDSLVVSRYALGLDALSRMGMSFTDDVSQKWFEGLSKFTEAKQIALKPAYMSCPDETSLAMLSGVGTQWITGTCAGFYGLQGRSIRLKSNMELLFQALSVYEFSGLRVGNLEMETAGIYLLAKMLGHRAISVNAIIANRILGTFSKDPYRTVDRLIQETLRRLSE